MRIHTEHTEPFIQALVATIEKDPASLEGWRFLHVSYRKNDDVEWYGKMLEHLQKSNKDLDCEVIRCADDDLLFLSRTVSVDGLYALANMFIVAASLSAGEEGAVALYDVYHDWRIVKALLRSKAGEASAPITLTSTHSFGESASLEEVFGEAKKLRTARQPQRVMVVEDDPLTRRIVTNALKENYALITASNAQEAVENYLLHAPDIVFLDIGLPDASGFDVLHQIMATDKDAYVVMFSSNSYLDNVTTALTHGASGFVAKPFRQEKMRRYIQESALHHRKHCA
jgi:two-component system chemotaxis response regulator CheY